MTDHDDYTGEGPGRPAPFQGEGRQAPPSARHKPAAEPTGPRPRMGDVAANPRAGDAAIDPELAEDLGPELEYRGDMLEAELEALRVESAEHRDRAMRAQAEFDNFRKRIMREREEERRRAGERLVSELLPALDNLERAIAHAGEPGGDLAQLSSGVEAVHAQILAVLGKEGVSVVNPVGEPFDPTEQQAVSQREDDTVPEGTVVDVFQKGYRLGDRVIRSAMVVVSTGGPQAD